MIYTFYSYKGGVGRSMALANVAECFYLQGLKVIVVDWDLESPGLESFFFEPAEGDLIEGSQANATVAMVRSRLGLIDMLIDYRRSFAGMLPPVQELAEPETTPDLSAVENVSEMRGEETTEGSGMGLHEDAQGPRPGPRFAATLDERVPELSHYLVTIRSENLESLSGCGGSLSLLPAGRRSKEYLPAYAQAVRDLGWDEFYAASHRGNDFFDWLRGRLLQSADVILIDAPTGVSEVGGVCTRHLADVVVALCAPNLQNLDGIAQMVEHLRSAETLEARDHRPLETIVVPARVDQSEPEEVSEFERRFTRLTEKSPLPASLQEQGLRLWDLQIPYRPELSFRERLVVRREGGGADATNPLEATYWTLAFHLSLLAPEDHAIRRPFARRSQATSPAHSTSVPAPMPQPAEQVETASAEDFSPLPATPPDSPDPFVIPPPALQSIEHQDELEAASLEVAGIGDFSAATPTTDEAIASSASALAAAGRFRTGGEPYRIPTEPTLERPKQALTREARRRQIREHARRAVPGTRSTAAEPSVPPVAGPNVAGRRLSLAWGWPAVGLSLLVLCTVGYFGARGSGDARTTTDPTRQIAPVLTAETPPRGPISPAVGGSSQPPAQERANDAPVDVGTSQPLPSAASPQKTSGPPGLYLRVGLGPSCPRMLNYRKQFWASGISDAKVVQLKSGACALVLGPYAADIAEGRRKEHNARHIRGFDSAIIVDERDFDAWL